jgi:deazaflavin-dependent oxidoreductase (nitroreductase family)
MSVTVSPKGTRGAGFPRPLRALFRMLVPLNVVFFRLSGRRMRIQGRPLLLLTTVGAKSGKERQTVLASFDDPGGILIVASNAGAAKHPSWFFNLARNPDRVWIERDGRKTKVRPESLRGAERAEAWRRIVAAAPGYGGYHTKTDREIPIVRLIPE